MNQSYLGIVDGIIDVTYNWQLEEIILLNTPSELAEMLKLAKHYEFDIIVILKLKLKLPAGINRKKRLNTKCKQALLFRKFVIMYI